MKQTIYILLTLISFGASCQNVDFNRDKSILYLNYEQKNAEVIAEIDDFSEYYPLVQAYYFEGKLNLNQKERILLEIYGDNQIIRDFPFTYSNIRIDSISNDTIVHFTVKGQSYTVCPNQTYEDSIQILKYQAILLKDYIFDDNNKTEKEIQFRLDAPTVADTMPRFRHDGTDLDVYLGNYGLKLCNEISSENAYIQIVLDENGCITNIRLNRRVESDDVTKRIIQAFNEMPKWIPAKNGNKPVPIKMTFELNEK
ncbi:energy transducer TonB [Saccharicrinis sp. FJH62]|uniref:energy transducer TonB n=1 Tax=Saccharicrinis sp. FJH62 TaxID=3344657 RepID=UPI0035D4BB79